ncbi:ABC transporter substrate-binding protein [Flavobacterium sp.]|uniref:ABC transporter substrate-binding protein n=1 Tax=Flavobacterium sp. TaxID=239 RepID=UPI002631EE9B|nr:ABC transporter substrate-binding protein [Flavobacterium sp.]
MNARMLRLKIIVIYLFLAIAFQCKEAPKSKTESGINKITEAKGFSLYHYSNFKILSVQDYFPGATQQFKYVLAKDRAQVPDSLRNLQFIQIPVTKIALSSTTHIPSLVLLGVESRLVAFPNTSYISSPNIRKRIDDGAVIDLGSNQEIDLEKLAVSKAELYVGYQIDQSRNLNETLKSINIPILLNADWNEQTALGKAEYIKFFGALYGKDAEADKIYNQIKSKYLQLKEKVALEKNKPTVMAGALLEDSWYAPQGNSWGAQFIKDAGASYIYANTTGTGSLKYDLEKVYRDCKAADYWIGPAQFEMRQQLLEADSRYGKFAAFQNKKIYSYSSKKGATGGVLFYELASNRPDLVLEDLVSIFHPHLLPNHKPYFFTAVL